MMIMAVLPIWLQEGFQSFFLFGSISLLLLLFTNFQSKKARSTYNLPPSPPKLPIIGNLHQLGKFPPMSLSNLAKQFGPIIYLQLGKIPTVVISSARLAKEVVKTHDLAISNRPRTFAAKYLFYDCTDIGFSPYGPYWRNVRKICTLELLSAKRVESFSFVREEEVARLVSRVAQSYPGVTNLSKLLGLYANTGLCKVAFGRDFSVGGDYDRFGFQKMLMENQELLGAFHIGDFFPSMEFILTFSGLKSRLRNMSQRFDKILDKIISEHLDPNRIKNNNKDLVDVLLDVHEKGMGDMPLTLDNVKAIILDMFTAGSDTTFVTLDWAMTELIMNPKVMERAQAEVRGIVGDRRVVIGSDLSRMPYLRAFMKEIFRLHPPAPLLIPRESMEDVIIDGYGIPAKTQIFINAWAIGRDPEVWGNPEVFEPERFMDSNVDFKGQDFELIPFGAGRRICPALTFAIAIVELPLAQLLHSFDCELPPGIARKDLDMTERFGITTNRIEDLIVVAKPHFV